LSSCVLDASALLAYLHGENGGDEVADAVAAAMSAASWAETLSKLAEVGRNPTAVSLGDRACLALALRLGLPALTADRRWLDLEGVDADVRAIRA
jgi:ribonuclease VapC